MVTTTVKAIVSFTVGAALSTNFMSAKSAIGAVVLVEDVLVEEVVDVDVVVVVVVVVVLLVVVVGGLLGSFGSVPAAASSPSVKPSLSVSGSFGSVMWPPGSSGLPVAGSVPAASSTPVSSS